MGTGMEAICAGMGGDGDRVQRRRLGMDAKFAGTVGDGDKLSSPCSSLNRTRVAQHTQILQTYCAQFLT